MTKSFYISPSSIDFSYVLLGQPLTDYFNIYNDGNEDVTIESIKFPNDFSGKLVSDSGDPVSEIENLVMEIFKSQYGYTSSFNTLTKILYDSSLEVIYIIGQTEAGINGQSPSTVLSKMSYIMCMNYKTMEVLWTKFPYNSAWTEFEILDACIDPNFGGILIVANVLAYDDFVILRKSVRVFSIDETTGNHFQIYIIVDDDNYAHSAKITGDYNAMNIVYSYKDPTSKPLFKADQVYFSVVHQIENLYTHPTNVSSNYDIFYNNDFDDPLVAYTLTSLAGGCGIFIGQLSGGVWGLSSDRSLIDWDQIFDIHAPVVGADFWISGSKLSSSVLAKLFISDLSEDWINDLSFTSTEFNSIVLDGANIIAAGTTTGDYDGSGGYGFSDIAVGIYDALSGSLAFGKQYGSTGQDTGIIIFKTDDTDRVFIGGTTTGDVFGQIGSLDALMFGVYTHDLNYCFKDDYFSITFDPSSIKTYNVNVVIGSDSVSTPDTIALSAITVSPFSNVSVVVNDTSVGLSRQASFKLSSFIGSTILIDSISFPNGFQGKLSDELVYADSIGSFEMSSYGAQFGVGDYNMAIKAVADSNNYVHVIHISDYEKLYMLTYDTTTSNIVNEVLIADYTVDGNFYPTKMLIDDNDVIYILVDVYVGGLDPVRTEIIKVLASGTVADTVILHSGDEAEFVKSSMTFSSDKLHLYVAIGNIVSTNYNTSIRKIECADLSNTLYEYNEQYLGIFELLLNIGSDLTLFRTYDTTGSNNYVSKVATLVDDGLSLTLSGEQTISGLPSDSYIDTCVDNVISDTNKIYKINKTTGGIEWTRNFNGHMINITTDGTNIYGIGFTSGGFPFYNTYYFEKINISSGIPLATGSYGIGTPEISLDYGFDIAFVGDAAYSVGTTAESWFKTITNTRDAVLVKFNKNYSNPIVESSIDVKFSPDQSGDFSNYIAVNFTIGSRI